MAKGVKLSAKIALDAVMLLILVLLYKAKVLTLTYHEVAGIGILLVFLVHCLFNWRWIANNAKKLFSPETPARTKFSYWISIALVLCFLVIVISGIFISKVLFKAQIEALAIDTSVFRTLHLFFSALSLILVGIHLGLYWGMVKGFFRKKFNISAAVAKPVCYILLAIVVVFGVYSVPTSGFSQWLLCPVIPIEHGHGDHGPKDEAAEQQSRDESAEGQEAQDEHAERSERSERDGHADQAEQATEAEGGAQSERTDRGGRAERDGQEEGGEHNDRGEAREPQDEQAAETEDGASSERSERVDREGADAQDDRDGVDSQDTHDGADSQDDRSSADSHGGENGKQKGSGNHGNNVELPNVLLTIAQFTSIVGLFAAITYYINEALRRRKKAAK